MINEEYLNGFFNKRLVSAPSNNQSVSEGSGYSKSCVLSHISSIALQIMSLSCMQWHALGDQVHYTDSA